jgi:TM2 domain-containing membrane protein YozV
MYPPGSMAYYNQAGYPLPYADLPGGRSPGVAVLLSFFIIGAGQLYNGDIAKGLGFFLGAVVSGILCVVLVGFAILPVLWICSMIDAHYGADQANRRLQAMLPPRR